MANKQNRWQNLKVNVSEVDLAFEVTVTGLKATHSIRQWRRSTHKLQVFKPILKHNN